MATENKGELQVKKRSLILAGGGMRLAYQAGVLIALEEQKLTFSHIDGTSGGIFNAGMMASGLGAYDIADRWRKLDIKNFMSLRPLKKYFKPLKMMGYADADGIRDKIFPDLGIDIRKINTHEGADITFNVCNFSDKTIEAIHHKDALEDHLLAGVSLPIVMPGIKIKDHWYSDAVWIKDANLIEAVKRGSEELWLVWAIGNTETYLPGALNQYVHMIEMSANGGLLEEYERIQMINEQISNGNSSFGQTKPVTLNVIKPKYPLPLDPDLYFNKIDARSLINMGYAEAKDNLKSIPDHGLPFDKQATKMSPPGTRLNIRTEFHGFLGENGTQHKASFYTYFVFSDHSDHQILHAYSSINMDLFKKEIPCFDHHIKASKSHGRQKLECTCKFNIEGESYEITASWELCSAIDLLLGLEFKSVEISVSTKNKTPAHYKGRLYQNIKQQFKSIYSTNVRHMDGTPGGLGSKYKMASKLLNYEI